jgi:hypothetical protein
LVEREDLTEVQRLARRFAPRTEALAVAGAILLSALGARPGEKKSSPQNSAAKLTHMLAGIFRGSSPGNELTIVSTPLPSAPTLQIEKLDVRVTGTYRGDAVLLRGVWRISYQGDAVWLVFIPGVDPIEAARRFSDPTFSPTELEAGCWSLLTSKNGTFEGTVKPFPNCRNALRAGEVQSVGKEWSALFSADAMRFENRETGEILSFSRSPAARQPG